MSSSIFPHHKNIYKGWDTWLDSLEKIEFSDMFSNKIWFEILFSKHVSGSAKTWCLEIPRIKFSCSTSREPATRYINVNRLKQNKKKPYWTILQNESETLFKNPLSNHAWAVLTTLHKLYHLVWRHSPLIPPHLHKPSHII